MALGFFFMVEGAEDALFLEKVLFPRLTEMPLPPEIIRFAQRRPQHRAEIFYKHISQGYEAYILADLNSAPCVTEAKQRVIKEQFNNFKGLRVRHLQIERRIIIVCPEIEAWYLAGLRNDNPFGIQTSQTTDSLTKEKTDELVGNLIGSLGGRLLFMRAVLNDYDWELAKTRNQSLRYFAGRLGL